MDVSTLLPTSTDHLSRHRRRRHHHAEKMQKQKQKQKQKQQRLVVDVKEDEEEVRRRRRVAKKRKERQQQKLQPVAQTSSSSWAQFKNLITCRTEALSQVRSPSGRLGSTCSKICAMKEVARNNTRVVHRGDHDHSPKSGGNGHHGTEAAVLKALSRGGGGGHQSSKGLQLRKLTGCYECHSISQPMRYPTPRTICSCPECGEVFTKPESLDHHQIVRHAVSELGPEDSGRKIVEIIFKSSWSKKETTVDRPILYCKIERIMKVHNTQRTVSRFEDYRDVVKTRAAAHLFHTTTAAANNNNSKKKNPRCAVDGNELLRFYSTTLTCSLGANGSTSLCSDYSSTPACGVCSVIRYGFGRVKQEGGGKGVRTTASSGRAHECFSPPAVDAGMVVGEGGRRRVMLVCRVIAGRVRRVGDGFDESGVGVGGGYDSVAGKDDGGGYGNLEELVVTNPRAILPCFVVVYHTSD